MRLLPAGHTPQRSPAQSLAHAFGGERQLLTPLRTGLGPVPDAHDCLSASPHHHRLKPPCIWLTHMPVRAQTGWRTLFSRTKAFYSGAKVTKCLSSQDRRAPCPGPRLLCLTLTLGASPAIILAFEAGKRGSEDLSGLSRANGP